MDKGRIWLSDCYWEENREMKPLPEELLRKFLSNKCLICDVTIATLSMALVHYESDDHIANATNYIRYNYNLTGKIVHPKDSFPPTLCEPCNVNSINRMAHLQHVSGSRHAKKMKLLQAAGETQYVRGISGAAQQRIEMEDSPGRRARVSSPLRSGEYVCSLCDVTSSNKSQMEMHNQGQKHQKKVSKLPVGELKDFFLRKGNCEPVSGCFSINSTGDFETQYGGSSDNKDPALVAKGRTSVDNSMASFDVRSPDSTLPVSGLTQQVSGVENPSMQSIDSLQVTPALADQGLKTSMTDTSACPRSTEVSSSSMVLSSRAISPSALDSPQTEGPKTSCSERVEDDNSSIFENNPSIEAANASKAEIVNSVDPSVPDEKFNDHQNDFVEMLTVAEQNQSAETICDPTSNAGTNGAAAGSSMSVTASFESFAALSEPVATFNIPVAALSEPFAALCEPTAALCEPTAALCEPTAALCEPTAALCKPTAALSRPVNSLGKPMAATVDASESQDFAPQKDFTDLTVEPDPASTSVPKRDTRFSPETQDGGNLSVSSKLDVEETDHGEPQLELEQQTISPSKPKVNTQVCENQNPHGMKDSQLDEVETLEPSKKSEVISTLKTAVVTAKSGKKSPVKPQVSIDGNKNSVVSESDVKPTDIPMPSEAPKPKEKRVIVIESSSKEITNPEMEKHPNAINADKSKIQSLRKAFADSEKEKMPAADSKVQKSNASQRRVIVISNSENTPAPKTRQKSRFSSPRRERTSSADRGRSSSNANSKPTVKSAVRTTTQSRENVRLIPTRSSSSSSEKSRGRSLTKGGSSMRASSRENRSTNRNRRGSSNSSHRSRTPSPSKRRSDDTKESSSDYSSPTKGNFSRFNQGYQNNWNRLQNRPWRGGGQWFRLFNPRFNNMRFNQPPWQGPGGPGPGGMGPGGPGMGPGPMGPGMGPGPGVMGPGPGGLRMPGYWNNVPCFQGPRNMGPWVPPPQSYWNMRPPMPTYWNPGIPSPEPLVEEPPPEEKKYPIIRRVCSDDSVEEGEVDDSGRECGIDRFGREKRDDEIADRHDGLERVSRKKKRKRKRDKRSRSSSPDSRSRSARRMLGKRKKSNDKKEPKKTDSSLPVDSEKIKQRLLVCHNQQSSRTTRKSDTSEDLKPRMPPETTARVPPSRVRENTDRIPEVYRKDSARRTADSFERVPSTSRRVPDSSGRLQENPDSMRTAEELKQKQMNEILMQVAVLKRRLLDAEEEKKRLMKKQKRKKKSKKKRRSSSSSSTSSSSDSSSSDSSDSPDDVKSLLAKISDDTDKRKKDKKKIKKKKKKSKKDEKKKKHDELLHSDSLLVSLEQFKTPDGTFQCKPCNMILASHKEFLAHITSEEHKKLCELIKRKLAE